MGFHGSPPTPPTNIAKLGFPDCARFAAASGPRDRGLLVSPSGGVRDAFVWIAGGLPDGEYPLPAEPITLDQRACEFEPRVFGIRAGQRLVVTSSDPFLHNVHGATAFNVPLPTAGARVERTFPRPGVMTPIFCDVHNWMHAFAGVVPHPFWAITDEGGGFTIRRLPAGRYTVEVWQERLGVRHAGVTLVGNETRTISIDYTGAP